MVAIQSGQTVIGLIKARKPNASNAEIQKLTAEVLKDNDLTMASAKSIKVGTNIDLSALTPPKKPAAAPAKTAATKAAESKATQAKAAQVKAEIVKAPANGGRPVVDKPGDKPAATDPKPAAETKAGTKPAAAKPDDALDQKLAGLTPEQKSKLLKLVSADELKKMSNTEIFALVLQEVAEQEEGAQKPEAQQPQAPASNAFNFGSLESLFAPVGDASAPLAAPPPGFSANPLFGGFMPDPFASIPSLSMFGVGSSFDTANLFNPFGNVSSSFSPMTFGSGASSGFSNLFGSSAVSNSFDSLFNSPMSGFGSSNMFSTFSPISFGGARNPFSSIDSMLGGVTGGLGSMVFNPFNPTGVS